MKRTIAGRSLELLQGDITTLTVDAIVNAANATLKLGGGVAGAIRSRGGPAIQEECDLHGEVEVGTAALTGAGNLPAMYVIHAVGPRMGEGDEERKLHSAVAASLNLAREKNLESLALPAIATGIFGFPIDRAATIILAAVRDHLQGETSLRRVVLCLFSDRDLRTFCDELLRQHPA
jgi:O-acetyl-ADP-ribose deacetylase